MPPVSALRANLILLLCALIWGMAFAAQKDGLQHIGPILFVSLRFSLAFAVMLLALWVQRGLWLYGSPMLRKQVHNETTPPRILPTRREWMAGSFLALFFLTGMLTQQMGLVYTSVANSSFITGLYVVLVPLLGLLHGRRLHWGVWLAALLALSALYLLCFSAGAGLDLSQFNQGDGLTLLCALAWTFHVYYVSTLSNWGGLLRIAAIQFFWTALLTAILAWYTEPIVLAGIESAWFTLFYTGVISGSLAFFLQLYGQKYAPPASSAVILSSEVLFGALAGWWFLGESISAKGLWGGLLMLLAMLLAQWGATRRA